VSPQERRQDEIYAKVLAQSGDDEHDLGEVLDAFAARVDQHPRTYRWSYVRDFDTQARLVVVDSRAARELEPDSRALLDPDEAAWLDEQLRGDVDHLLVGTSLPFLLARGLHHLEAFSEALAGGAWGSGCARWSTSSTGARSRRASRRCRGRSCGWLRASAGVLRRP
jgi:hypothetical protein